MGRARLAHGTRNVALGGTVRRRAASAQMGRHVSAAGLPGLFPGRLGGARGFLGCLTLSPARTTASARSEVKARSSAFSRFRAGGSLFHTHAGFLGGATGFGFFLALLLPLGGFVEFPIGWLESIK